MGRGLEREGGKERKNGMEAKGGVSMLRYDMNWGGVGWDEVEWSGVGCDW